MAAVASLTHSCPHRLATQLQKSTKLKIWAWFYWSMSLAHSDFIFCQKTTRASVLLHTFNSLTIS